MGVGYDFGEVDEIYVDSEDRIQQSMKLKGLPKWRHVFVLAGARELQVRFNATDVDPEQRTPTITFFLASCSPL